MASIDRILDKLKDHQFVFHEVEDSFSTTSSFTDAEIMSGPFLEKSSTENESSTEKYLTMQSLFDFSIVKDKLPSGVKDFLLKSTPWTNIARKVY